MDVIKAVQNYMRKMLSGIPGAKVAVLDKDTTGIMSMVLAQSQVLQHNVYLFELLASPNREHMTHLKAAVFVRPTQDNIDLLTEELKNPKYGEYHLFFSNLLNASDLELLAKSDHHRVVQTVQEYYADFYAVNPDTFSLNIPSCITHEPSEHRELLDGVVSGVGALLLALKRRPVVRFEKKSQLCENTAREMVRRMEQYKSLHDFPRRPAVLLIIDRCSDPVTPLLSQWTYQAMVHDLLTIRNNRVDMKEVAGISKEMQEIVLSAELDQFYAQNLYANFGELAICIKELLDDLQKKHHMGKNISSIEEMKSFVDNYGDYQQLSGSVAKHTALLHHLSHIVDRRCLMPVSKLEQEIACSNDHSFALKGVTEMIQNHKVRNEDKLRIVMLYALRYENHSSSNLRGLEDMLRQSGVSQNDIGLIRTLLQYGGEKKRSGDVLNNKSFFSSLKTSFKKGLQGATCVYTQHKPMIFEQVEELFQGKLSEIEYPTMGGSNVDSSPTDIIIFMVGGVTYEEAKFIHDIQVANPNKNVVIGGTTIHNTASFLEEMQLLQDASQSYR